MEPQKGVLDSMRHLGTTIDKRLDEGGAVSAQAREKKAQEIRESKPESHLMSRLEAAAKVPVLDKPLGESSKTADVKQAIKRVEEIVATGEMAKRGTISSESEEFLTKARQEIAKWENFALNQEEIRRQEARLESEMKKTAETAQEARKVGISRTEANKLDKEIERRQAALWDFRKENVPDGMISGEPRITAHEFDREASKTETGLRSTLNIEERKWIEAAKAEDHKIKEKIKLETDPEYKREKERADELARKLEEETALRKTAEAAQKVAEEKLARTRQELEAEKTARQEAEEAANQMERRLREAEERERELQERLENETKAREAAEQRLAEEKRLREEAERNAADLQSRLDQAERYPRPTDIPEQNQGGPLSEPEQKGRNKARGLWKLAGATAAGVLGGTGAVMLGMSWVPVAATLGSGQSLIRGSQELLQEGRFAELMGKDWGLGENREKRKNSERTGRWADFFDRSWPGRFLAVSSDVWANTEQVAGVGTARFVENVAETADRVGNFLGITDRYADKDRESAVALLFHTKEALGKAENAGKTPQQIIIEKIRDIFEQDVEKMGMERAQIFNAQWLTSMARQLSWDSEIGNYKIYDLLKKRMPDFETKGFREEDMLQLKELNLSGVVRVEAQRLIGQLEARGNKELANVLAQKLSESRSVRLALLNGSYLLSRTAMGAVKALDVAALFHLDEIGRGLDWWRGVFTPHPVGTASAIPTPGAPEPIAHVVPQEGAGTFVARRGDGLINILERMYETGGNLEGQRQAWGHITDLMGKPENFKTITDWATLHHHPEVIEAARSVIKPGFNPFSTPGIDAMYKLHWAVGQGAKFIKP